MNRNKLNIGYIMQANAIDMFTVSGPRQHVEATIRGLEKRGHNVRVVAIQQDRTQWTNDLQTWYPGEFGLCETMPFRMAESVIRGVQSRLQLPFFRFFDSFRYSDACVAALDGFDVLYERDSTISYGGLIAARRLEIPIVLEVNGDLVEEWEHIGLHFHPIQQRVVHFITRQTYHHASHIVAVGETIRQRLINRWGLDSTHVSVVTNGAHVDKFVDPNGGSNTRIRYSISNGPMIIFVGGFEPWHGLELILEGFGLIAADWPDARLVFVGDGRERSDLQYQVNAKCLSEQVIFTGRVEHQEVAQLLNAADVAVIYHRASAAQIVETPLKLFEYMAAGKAIVAPAVPNMERVLIDRESALLVPPDNPEALADALNELLKNSQLRKSLGQAAQKEAIEKHSWDRAVAELETILYSMVEK